MSLHVDGTIFQLALLLTLVYPSSLPPIFHFPCERLPQNCLITLFSDKNEHNLGSGQTAKDTGNNSEANIGSVGGDSSEKKKKKEERIRRVWVLKGPQD